VTDFARKTKQILKAAKRLQDLFCFRKGCSFSIYAASTTAFSQEVPHLLLMYELGKETPPLFLKTN